MGLVFRFENGGQFLHGFLRWDFDTAAAQTLLLLFPGKLKLRTGSFCTPIRTATDNFFLGCVGLTLKAYFWQTGSACYRPARKHISGWSTPAISPSKFCSLTSLITSFEFSSATTASTTSTGKMFWTLTNPSSIHHFLSLNRVSGVYNSDMTFAKTSQWQSNHPIYNVPGLQIFASGNVRGHKTYSTIVSSLNFVTQPRTKFPTALTAIHRLLCLTLPSP